jgi:hypothetical protein
MQSDSQKGTGVKEKKLDDYLHNINSTVLDILRLSDAGYGDYMTIAYEWSWVEAMDVLEILEIRHEMEIREKTKQRVQAQ